ncbi:MAG: GAF domain-containing sensor histidine kinase [Anaerolineales bacterium]|nr:MAG: GAF domain-containing sensor histidine kinase [Anaerolineales bacterium]
MSRTDRSVARSERILEISRELTSTVRLEPLLHKIVKVAAELTDSEVASLLLLDEKTDELRFRVATGDPAGQLRDIPVPVEDSIAGSVLISGEPAIVADAQSDARHYSPVGQQVDYETRSLLAVRLSVKERHIGVLEAINKQAGKEFGDDDVETLVTLAAQAAVAIENARLVSALQDAYDQLGRLDRLKSDFISIASHELRTPLSVILLYAGMLQESVDEAAEPQLNAVLRAAMRLKHIIETMLNLRYLETGEMELVPDRVDLGELILEACQEYEDLAQAKSVAMEVHLPDETLHVDADKQKLRVVLDNLISNAVKFTPHGGRVQLSLRPVESGVEISVSDSGIGIPAGELERIFDRFHQVGGHMTRRHGGMGLGLAVVRGLVELHGGRVWAESEGEAGSRFVVTLPATSAPKG